MEAVHREAQALDLVLRENMAFLESQIDKLPRIIHQCIGGVWMNAHAIKEDKVGKLFNELSVLANLVHSEEVT